MPPGGARLASPSRPLLMRAGSPPDDAACDTEMPPPAAGACGDASEVLLLAAVSAGGLPSLDEAAPAMDRPTSLLETGILC